MRSAHVWTDGTVMTQQSGHGAQPVGGAAGTGAAVRHRPCKFKVSCELLGIGATGMLSASDSARVACTIVCNECHIAQQSLNRNPWATWMESHLGSPACVVVAAGIAQGICETPRKYGDGGLIGPPQQFYTIPNPSAGKVPFSIVAPGGV